jgi:acyl-CoA synthetase (AMP-forming)/AMP-acid ligase II
MPLLPGGAPLNIAGGVREFAVASPRAAAVVDGNRTLDYAALDERASRLACALLDRGVQAGDFVGVVLGNRLEYCEVAAGLAKAGMISVPVNPRYTRREASYVLSRGRVRAVIGDQALGELYASTVDDVELAAVLSVDGAELGEPYEHALSGARAVDPRAPVGDTDPFTCCFTGGTTGLPKGVLLSHRTRALIFLGAALEWGLGPGRRTLAIAPMYHGAGFAFAYVAVATGGTVAMLRRWDPEHFLALVADFRPHSVFLVPAHLQMLRALGDDTLADADFGSVDVIYCNAAPLPQPLKLWAMDSLPHVDFHEVYGSTETGVVADCRPPDMRRKERSVGPPWFMNEAKLLDLETREPVTPGEPGELFVRSPMLFSGYLDDPDATARATDDEGFVTVGDVAIADDEGFLYIVDRVTDMVLTGGVNVYPREVEEVLATHPGVAEAAVIGEPDDRWGERVVAVVVARGSGATSDDLDRHARADLAGFKVPREYRFVDVLPRNAAGKVLKRELRGPAQHPPA